ncbi:sulfurtransferase [Chondromyces crocatus]|uniref:Thiosulfate sulfurtransferase n=1 Tax=Chondromyces crocatus TaxID=52 RepID=A0A0K1EPR9_CHOCO|nr:sulfurtransferase [Chondromyces crocatus]AKT42814.1 thiosulfate sulfurtransferase [Chondromyces crocatus]
MSHASPPGPLVDVSWLAGNLGDPAVRLVDCRWYLGGGKTGAEEYRRGHLPGAVHLDVDAHLASPRGTGPGRHPLPRADAFAQVLSTLGVTPGMTIVAYDDAGGAMAARLWWLLRYFGFGDMGRVLDGGLQAWLAAGHALSTDVPTLAPTPLLPLQGGGAPLADRATVDRLRHDPTAVLLDARATERYEGRIEPIDPRPGHIPGAHSAPFTENLVAPGGTFLDRGRLEAVHRATGALDAPTIVCYCGSGVTACHDLLALALLGREDAVLYEGSWSDWSSDSSLPAATGPSPRGT